MKKLIIILLSLLPMLAQAQGVERIYVSTDRSVYIAGDEIWCSLFCMDGESRSLSAYSAVSYVELVSDEGTVATAKIGLMEGRGAGKFRIPAGTPTGNYKLLAYTAGYPDAFGPGAKTVSVFNTTSVARVKDGVKIVEDYKVEKSVSDSSDGVLTLSTREIPRSGNSFSLAVKNNADAATLSFSVYEVDGIREPAGNSLDVFLKELSSPSGAERSSRTQEYEGEIVYAAVEGLDPEQLKAITDQAVATLSSAGSPSDVYVGKVGENGRLMFFTNNIYGDRELVCEVHGKAGYISLMDPFRYPSVGGLEKLELSPALFGDLVQRKAALGASLQVDTLVQFMPRRQDILLGNVQKKVYHLDDYTRFPSFQEVIVEIVREIRIRTFMGKHHLQMVVSDAVGSRRVVKENLLVMMDGVVISDLSLLENMDAMLLEDVELYGEDIAMGGLSYNGCVNFTTRKNYVKAMQFPSNVRVVDFKGVCYPVAYLGAPVRGTDHRPLLYWNPLLKLEAGESLVIPLTAPSRSGSFRMVAEGITLSGKPFREVFDFEIR